MYKDAKLVTFCNQNARGSFIGHTMFIIGIRNLPDKFEVYYGERKCTMFPTINLRETGVNLHRIMDKRGITPKDIKEFLNLGSIQTVYNWCNGLNMPTVDNLYALSQLLQVSIDEIICGNRKAIVPEPVVIIENPRTRRLYAYYKQLNRMLVA